ncbi:MAG: hypothetical protein M1831_004789 [Alyxoria varia]|nr:MAG: hypothetical protein M1831_004789 [Alyxoria varia]
MSANASMLLTDEPRKVTSVAVFLAANNGADPKYEELVQRVATAFLENGWVLVYGGSGRGLMGTLGQTAANLGVSVHGVKPRAFLQYEKDGKLPKFGQHELVDDLFSQKKRMVELSDAFVILPGGFGTLEEYATIRIWSKLGICRHPVILLNFQNYYTALLEWISGAKGLGFISQSSASVVSVVDSVEQMSKNLYAALNSTPGLAQNIGMVKTLASAVTADSKQFHHCLLAIFLHQHCIVIDLVFSSKAFKVPYNGSFETLPYITTSGYSRRRRLCYLSGPSGERKLTMENIDSEEAPVQFLEIDHHTALEQISKKAAKETIIGLQVPNKKLLVVRSLVNEKPTKIASDPIDAQFIMTSCRVQVDFAQQTLTLQIPLTDWLLKFRNRDYLSRLQKSPMYRPISDAVVNLVADLDPPQEHERISNNLQLMEDIAELLGLVRGEIQKMADSVRRIWRQEPFSG